MTSPTDTESRRPQAGSAPVVVRRRRNSSNKKRRRTLLVSGISLITVGAILLGWLAWQFWGTNWVSKGRHSDVVAALEKDWDSGRASAQTDFGTASGILRIPRFGADYAVPILEGSSDEVLASGIGHMEDTADVGQPGNYVLAAHRITHGEPFADFPELQAGDKVMIETATVDFTYQLDTGGMDLIVPFTASWVLDDFPVNPDAGGTTALGKPGDELITLLTCSELFHTENRSVVFGRLVKAEAKLP